MNTAKARVVPWLSSSQPRFQLTAGMAQSVFSDESILRISIKNSLSCNYTNSNERQMGFGTSWTGVLERRLTQKLWELGLGSLFSHLAVILLIKDVTESVVWHVLCFFTFLHIALECNCMVLYYYLQLENDVILFCILRIR